MEQEKAGRKEDWISAMIERESTPKPLRTDTIEEFCKKWDIAESTYGFQRRKKENRKRVVEIWLSEAINCGNEVLTKLGEKALSGDTKAIELYMKFVLDLTEGLDIKTDGKALNTLTPEQTAILDKILYAQKGSDRQNDTGNSRGESIHSEQGV